MTVRQYIGARYVPLFADPIQWDNTNAYEPLTVVMNLGTSYVSRQYVPAGIAIDNEDYWIAWADYNAQIEAYRAEVQAYNGRIENLELKFDENGKLESNLVITDSIADGAVTSAKIADGTIATADIADSAVTNAKIADSAVNSAKISDHSVKLTDLENTNVLIFGDSWSDTRPSATTYTKWPIPFAAMTHTNIFNYARNGSTLSGTTPVYSENGNVLGQINNALLDTTYDHNCVSLIIIMGGVNDFRSSVSSTSVIEQMTLMVNTLKQNYPHARIVLMLNFSVSITHDMWAWIQTIKRNVKVNTGIQAYSMCGWLQLSNFISDWIHPNDAGYREICSNVLAACFGGVFNYIPCASNMSADGDSLTAIEYFTDDTYKREFIASTNSSTAHVTTFGNTKADNKTPMAGINSFASLGIDLQSGNTDYLKFASVYPLGASSGGINFKVGFPAVAGTYRGQSNISSF